MSVWSWGSGGSYSTLVAALTAAKAANNPLTDNESFPRVGASIENAQFNFNGWDHGEYELDIYDPSPPLGIIEGAVVTEVNPGQSYWLWLSNGNPGQKTNVRIHDLYLKRTSVVGAGFNQSTFITVQIAGSAQGNFEVYNNILDGNGIQAASIWVATHSIGSCSIHHNKILGHNYRALRLETWKDSVPLSVKNNTVLCNFTGFPNGIYLTNSTSGQVMTLSNNYVFNGAPDITFGSNTGSVIRETNATEDTSGDISEALPGDNLKSIDTASEEFLVPIDGSVVSGAYIDPTDIGSFGSAIAITEDIAGNAIPGPSGSTSIGAVQQQYISIDETADWPQQGDVLQFQTDDDGEINVADGIVEMNGGLETAFYNSIFGGNEDDPGEEDNTLEFWGNKLETDPVRKIRSRTQHLLQSLPATSGNLLKIEDAVKFDTQWALDTGVADTIAITISIPSVNRVAIVVNINKDGQDTEFKFEENWRYSL